MNLQERLDLIKEVGEEIVTEEELIELLKDKKHPIAYDGFEPSGKIHLAQGVLRAINVNKLTKAGVKFKFWVADWFALMNNKMDGDLAKIQKTGEYFIEVWKACGMDMENVEFLWSSDVMNDTEYWLKVINIGRLNSVTRITRCSQIMGRSERDTLSAAQIFYPCMQCADIFHLKADITQLGMDQRKVNMLAREVAPKMGFKKPIELKMSKSKPDSAIFMADSKEEIIRKIKKAYCPEKSAQDNPILEYCKYIIFEKFSSFKIERPEKYGGNLEFKSYSELESAFVAGDLHAMDLKNSTANYINRILEPIRRHFEKNAQAKKLKDEVESYEVTR